MTGTEKSRRVRELDDVTEMMLQARDVLGEFNADLVGMGPGITANLYPGGFYAQGRGYLGESLHLENIEWQWLKPLLEELRERRRADGFELFSQYKAKVAFAAEKHGAVMLSDSALLRPRSVGMTSEQVAARFAMPKFINAAAVEKGMEVYVPDDPFFAFFMRGDDSIMAKCKVIFAFGEIVDVENVADGHHNTYHMSALFVRA